MSHKKDLKQAAKGGRKPLQGSQELRAILGTGRQMHKKQHQRGFLFSSHLAKGKKIQEAVEGARRGPEGKSLEAGLEDRAHCAPVMKHNSGPQTREVVDGGGRVTDRGCRVEEPHSSHHGARGK